MKQATPMKVAVVFAVWALIKRKQHGIQLADPEFQLATFVELRAMELGGPLLRVPHKRDLVEGVDHLISNAALYAFFQEVAEKAISLELSEEDAEDEVSEEDINLFGRNLAERLHHGIQLAVKFTGLVKPTLDARGGVRQVVADAAKDPLSFLGMPTLSVEVSDLLLEGLRATGYLLGLTAAIARPYLGLPEWMAHHLVKGFCSGIWGYLRLLASAPELDIGEEIIPLRDRLDLARLDKEAAASPPCEDQLDLGPEALLQLQSVLEDPPAPTARLIRAMGTK